MFPKNTIEFLRSIVRIKKKMCQKLCSSENVLLVYSLTRSISELLFSILHCLRYLYHIHNISILMLCKNPASIDEYWIFCIYFHLLIDLTLLKHLFLLLIANNIPTMVNVTVYSIFLLLVKIYWLQQ